MQDLERLGAFYPGRIVDPDAGEPRNETVPYEARDLTTHALWVRMIGNGKTGLCISMLEEAEIDGIPAIVIDPKGDAEGRDHALPGFIADIQRPPFDRLGVMDLASIYPASDRLGLAITLNNLLASPGCQRPRRAGPLVLDGAHRAIGGPAGARPLLAGTADAHRPPLAGPTGGGRCAPRPTPVGASASRRPSIATIP